MEEATTIWVVAEEVAESTTVEGRRSSDDVGGQFGPRLTEKVTTVITKRVPIDAAALKAQIGGLLSVVSDLFNQAEQQTGMKLSEVQLSVEINAEGQVSLVGTGGKVGNKGGITLKFTRP